jgi:hypothetical protein
MIDGIVSIAITAVVMALIAMSKELPQKESLDREVGVISILTFAIFLLLLGILVTLAF